MFRFSFSGTKNIVFGTLKIGKIDPEIPNLEFENDGLLENQVFLPTEQAEAYLKIYVLIYHSTYICPIFFLKKHRKNSLKNIVFS